MYGTPGHPQFQSTHSLRSATLFMRFRQIKGQVSIHALLAECDCRTGFLPARRASFNPRTPCGVRLFSDMNNAISCDVSIHALLAECDSRSKFRQDGRAGFNPRTPCGVRQDCVITVRTVKGFQSTHSLRSATGHCDICETYKKVSIHALLAECDSISVAAFFISFLFQSTHSLRSATYLTH